MHEVWEWCALDIHKFYTHQHMSDSFYVIRFLIGPYILLVFGTRAV